MNTCIRTEFVCRNFWIVYGVSVSFRHDETSPQVSTVSKKILSRMLFGKEKVGKNKIHSALEIRVRTLEDESTLQNE